MTEIRRTLSGWLNHVSVDYTSVEKVQNIGNCSMNMWQSRVVKNQLNLAYFDLRYHVQSAVERRISVKGGAHTNCVDMSGIHASTQCV